MRKAEGFITADGTFFENEAEAVLYEAELKLRQKMAATFPNVAQENFFTILTTVMPELGGYVDAHKAARLNRSDTTEDEIGTEDTATEEAEVSDGLGHVSGTEEDLASLLELPTRGPERVPDVGRGPRTAQVSDGRAVDGSGVRGENARGVRSGKSVATRQGATPRESR